MGRKKVNYNHKGIENLPNDKPVLYTIETASGNPNYVGIAKRGRVNERLTEHLDEIPGSKIKIEQFNSIKDAREKEQRVIKKNSPKYNKLGK